MWLIKRRLKTRRLITEFGGNKGLVAPWKKSYDQPRQHIKKQRHYFADKGLSIQNYGFSSSHVWMWELVYKGSWPQKHWCFWTVVLEKTLESPLDCKEIKPVNPKGNQSWIFMGRNDAETETLILWPQDVKNWPAGKDWRQEEKGMTEDEMVEWHHRLDGYEFELAPGVGDGQGTWHAAVHGVTKSQTRLNWLKGLVWYKREKNELKTEENSVGNTTNNILYWVSLVTQLVKNLPTMREAWVRCLGWEDPLEKGKATHSSILAWSIPWTV